MSKPYGPSERTDSVPPHDNVIRRFREELRMDRKQFAELIEANIDTLRVWEASKSFPRPQSAIRIIEVAERNDYPLQLGDLYPKRK